MKFSFGRLRSSPWALAVSALGLLQVQQASAVRIIESRGLQECMENSQFSASFFRVQFTPDNGTLALKFDGVSSIRGMVEATVQVIAYGFTAVEQVLKPCELDLMGMCPMQEGQIDLESNVHVSEDVVAQLPGIAFNIPDLDGKVRIWIRNTDSNKTVACVEANLSNGKTVDQKAVGFATAIIAGMGLIASGVTSGFGHSTTAAHVAANALSLFTFFQTQALNGMTSVPLPPIVASWTQNFDWSMGIMRVRFMQNIFHWYIQATGGSPTNLLGNISKVSVVIQRRSLEYGAHVMRRGLEHLYKRSNNDNILGHKMENIKLTGIKRVSYKGNIELTNLFLTGLSFFCLFLIVVVGGVAFFKWALELSIRMKWIRGTKFQEFRNGWQTVLKGIMYRVILIGYPQMATLCLWELTVKDSSGAIVLAVFFFITMTGVLGWGAFKVLKLAQRSVALHKNPAYILYSDPKALNRWGFLYVMYRGDAYYYVVPFLGYILVKAMLVAFSQSNGTIQAIGLLLLDFGYMVAAFMLKPWMDKRVNIFNLSIACLNFFNSILLLFFTGAFRQPGLVTGVMGVVYFVVNAAFALVLLILVLASSVYAVTAKNPDVRYQPMRDDRNSFIKSNPHLGASTELDALGASARGDKEIGGRVPLDDDEASFYNPPIAKQQYDAQGVPLPPSTATSNAYHEQDPSTLYPVTSYGEKNQHQNYNQNQYQTAVSSTNLGLLDPSGQSRTPSRNTDRSGGNGYNNQYGEDQYYGAQQHPRQSRANDDYRWHPGQNDRAY